MTNLFCLQVAGALRYSELTDPYLKSLLFYMEKTGVVPSEDVERVKAIKERGRRLFAPELGGRYAVWEERPIRQDMIEYAALDVSM